MDKEINYSTIIPDFEVKGNHIEYYFLGIDIFGNQRNFPYNTEEALKLPILKPSDNIIDDYEINLIFKENAHIALTTETIEVRLEDQNEIKE